MNNKPTYEELEQRVKALEMEARLRQETEEALHKSEERYRAERLIRERLESVLEFAGAVCHEMSQPLQGVLGNCELLMMDMDEENAFYDRINIIKTQMDRMNQLTKKLMTIREYKM